MSIIIYIYIYIYIEFLLQDLNPSHLQTVHSTPTYIIVKTDIFVFMLFYFISFCTPILLKILINIHININIV